MLVSNWSSLTAEHNNTKKTDQVRIIGMYNAPQQRTHTYMHTQTHTSSTAATCHLSLDFVPILKTFSLSWRSGQCSTDVMSVLTMFPLGRRLCAYEYMDIYGLGDRDYYLDSDAALSTTPMWLSRQHGDQALLCCSCTTAHTYVQAYLLDVPNHNA